MRKMQKTIIMMALVLALSIVVCASAQTNTNSTNSATHIQVEVMPPRADSYQADHSIAIQAVWDGNRGLWRRQVIPFNGADASMVTPATIERARAITPSRDGNRQWESWGFEIVYPTTLPPVTKRGQVLPATEWVAPPTTAVASAPVYVAPTPAPAAPPPAPTVVAQSAPKPEPAPTPQKVAAVQPVSQPTAAATTDSSDEEDVIKGSSDTWEAIIGGGYYTVADGFTSGHGSYLNGRFRVRPWLFRNIRGGSHDLSLGAFAYGNLVSGVAGIKASEYSKTVWAIGPTMKLYGGRWDLSTDLGYGQVREESPGRYGYDETQTVVSPFAWYSNYSRRLNDDRWFAKTEVGAGAVIPVGTEGSRHMANGNLFYTQWVYDWKLYDSVRLSAGVEANVGYDQAGAGYNFFRVGPAMSLELKNQSVATLSLSHKDKLGVAGDLWLANFSVNLGHVLGLMRGER